MLLTAEEASTLDERQSYDLIFLPGFSTAEKVSDVSGRGVGMDVVKAQTAAAGGRVDVRDDDVGRRGTRGHRPPHDRARHVARTDEAEGGHGPMLGGIMGS